MLSGAISSQTNEHNTANEYNIKSLPPYNNTRVRVGSLNVVFIEIRRVHEEVDMAAILHKLAQAT